MTCELCLTFSGRINANRRCCQIRDLAAAPKHSRQAFYDQVRRDEGEEAVKQLVKEVTQEYQRKFQYVQQNQKGKK